MTPIFEILYKRVDLSKFNRAVIPDLTSRKLLRRNGGFAHDAIRLGFFAAISIGSVSALASTGKCGQRLSTSSEVRTVRVAYDAQGVYVYQAFTVFAAKNAVRNQSFKVGEGFKTNRMSWLKLSLGWMLYRSDYGRKSRQERILRIKISHQFFAQILKLAQPSHFNDRLHSDEQTWRNTMAKSDVIFQWDPDRDLSGGVLNQAVLQLGLRGQQLKTYAHGAILEIVDVTSLAQKIHAAKDKSTISSEVSPERVYPLPVDLETRLSF